MKLVVGLGNPGAQYDKTRHNAGFMVADALALRHASGQIPRSRFHAVTLDASIAGEKTLLMKPTTYMNRSGQSVGEAVRFFKLDPQEDLVVLVDDIALPVGQIRVRKNGGSGGHNGLSDIDRVLGGEGYMRVRIGVGSVPKLMNQADWVLSRFMAEELDELGQSVGRAADATERILSDGVIKAMNEFNQKLAKPKKPRGKDSGEKAPESKDGPAQNDSNQNENNTNPTARQG